MQRALILAILGIGLVCVGLTLLIALAKLVRERRAARRTARRATLEPRLREWLRGMHASGLVSLLATAPSAFDLLVLEELLLEAAEEADPKLRQTVRRAVEELGIVDRCLEDLGHRDWWRRAVAAEKLGLAGSTRAVTPLTAALEDEVFEVRMRAARALARQRSQPALAALLGALDQATRWSTLRVADVLADAGADVVPPIQAAYPTLGSVGRVAAMDVIARLRPAHAAPWLAERLGDENADVRARACHALGRVGRPEDALRLLAALDDPEWPVRALAARALGELRAAHAVPQLAALLEDREWWVRANAAEALVACGDEGLAGLERMLESPDRFARDQAVSKLEQAGLVDRRVGELGSYDSTRAEAARAFVKRLIQAGDPGRLRSLSEGHPDPRARAILAALLPPRPASGEVGA